MFRTRPFLSSVWKVQATSAGIFTRKLVSGLPSGSAGCLLAVALVQRGGSDRAERRRLGQVGRLVAVVGNWGRPGRFIDGVSRLVGTQGARRVPVVRRIVLDEQHVVRSVDRLARLDQIDAA